MSNFSNINWAGGNSTGANDININSGNNILISTNNVAGTPAGVGGGFLNVLDASPAPTGGVAGLVLASLSNTVFVASGQQPIAIQSYDNAVNIAAGGNITLTISLDGNGVSICNVTNGGYGLLTVDSNSDLYWNGTKLN